MKKFLVLMLASVLVLSACGTSSKKKELTIAVEAEYQDYFKELAKEFTKDKDFTIKVVSTKMTDLLEALPTQKGNSADIFMMPNDRIGDLAKQNLIKSHSIALTDYTSIAQEAAKYEGANYILPMSAETTLLLYNKDKVTEVPKTLSSIAAKDWAAPLTNFYFSAGMYLGFGGEIFKDNDPNKVGLNNEGSIKAGTEIQKLYASGSDTWTLMKDHSIAEETSKNAFKDGTINFIINGPWAIKDFEDSGIKVGAVAIPNWDETNGFKPLVGTKGLTINAYTAMATEAEAFLTYISTKENAVKWHEMTKEVSPHTGVVYEKGSIYETIFEATTKGVSMPNNPEFTKVWTPMEDAGKQIANGTDVKTALDAAVTTITNEIAAMK